MWETNRLRRNLRKVPPLKPDRDKLMIEVRALSEDSSRPVPLTRPNLSWTERLDRVALAFRGYDVQNLGRAAELLDHPVFGVVVQEFLERASTTCAEATGQRVDLSARVRAGEPSTLDSFPQDVATIVALELAQLRILEEHFEMPVHDARLSMGYSVGEPAAMIFGGVYDYESLMSVPLSLAPDCAELAHDVTLGVLFTRGPDLPREDVDRLCMAVSSEGKGLIGPSAFLSPNTTLILGQGSTIDRLEKLKAEFLPEGTHLRRNPNKWPPLHTPLVWHRNIPNRAATLAYQIDGGLQAPRPQVVSCVTGDFSYDELNSRELLIRWTDHPQQLWDAILTTLGTGIESVLHIGPAPNLVPATFERLANNVSKQLKKKYMHTIGRGVSKITRQAWLSRLLPSQTALLRAPFLEHIVLEDWLLAHPLPTSTTVALPEAIEEVASSEDFDTIGR